jgi:hypothetical protein
MEIQVDSKIHSEIQIVKDSQYNLKGNKAIPIRYQDLLYI